MEKRSTPSLQITDRFGAQAAFASLRLPDGTEAAVPAEHAAAIYVNEQPAFRVVCTPALLPQLALGRLLTEGWIASADEVEQIAVCAEGAKVQVYLRHPLPTRRAAAQEVASCCTDNIALGSPVELQPLRPVPGLALQPEWVERLTAILGLGDRFVFGLTLLLVMALLLVIGNTIRLHIENRRSEIEVIKLVGGTDGYVRRPFLYMGALYGLGAGLLAWGLLAFGLDWLNDAVVRLAGLYGSDFALDGVPVADGLSLLLGALFLGYIGAWLAVARHLSELAPR